MIVYFLAISDSELVWPILLLLKSTFFYVMYIFRALPKMILKKNKNKMLIKQKNENMWKIYMPNGLDYYGRH
jgi:hypothetical protein